MFTNTDTEKLDELIVATIDSIRGYVRAAEAPEAGPYSYFFREIAGERRAVLDRLQEMSRGLGGHPADHGSTAGAAHRRQANLRRALVDGEAATLKEIERSEDHLKDHYVHVLEDRHITPPTREGIEHCFTSVMRGHHRAKHLRHALTVTA